MELHADKKREIFRRGREKRTNTRVQLKALGVNEVTKVRGKSILPIPGSGGKKSVLLIIPLNRGKERQRRSRPEE